MEDLVILWHSFKITPRSLKKYFLSFGLIFTFNLFAQSKDYRHEILKSLKGYRLDSISDEVSSLPVSISKEFLKKEILYLMKGVNGTPESNKKNIKFSYLDSVVYFNYLGDYYKRKVKPNDSQSFEYYLKSLRIAENNNDTLLVNESLRRINGFFLKNFNDKELYTKYVNLLNLYVKDDIDLFWKKYFGLVYKMTYSSFSDDEFLSLEKQFLELEKLTPDNEYFKGVIYHMIGIFYTYPLDNKNSKKYFRKALLTYEDDLYYSYSRKVRTVISLAIAHFDDKSYKEAIEELKSVLNNEFIKQDFELKQLIFQWIYKSYEQLDMDKEAKEFLKLHMQVKDSVDYYGTIEKAREVDVKYDVKKKNTKIRVQEKMITTLNKKITILLPIIGIVFLLLVTAYLLLKYYKKRSKVLEKDQSETLQKLDELKNIVIKNHIILKDKTKVYISDLMYIKSDDHYLNIFLSDGKNHFVRGKLIQIKEELPPNFIRCHRSYIVNSNFIKQVNSTSLTLIDKTQIPLSRSYKSKF